jgi:hypothetical protein
MPWPRLAVLASAAWVHDPAHRGGVRYANAATRARFDAARLASLVTATARLGGAARFEANRSEARPGAGRRAAPAPIPRGTSALYRTALPPRAADTHGELAFRRGAAVYGAPAARGGAAFHAGPNGFHGGLGLRGPHRGGPGGRPRPG